MTSYIDHTSQVIEDLGKPLTKVCGITDETALDAAVDNGADFLGFSFFTNSPNVISPAHAAELCDALPDEISKVGVFVDPSDDDLDHICRYIRLDYIQLHGSETEARVDEIRMNTGLPTIKTIRVSSAKDVRAALSFDGHADILLFEAKQPNDFACSGKLEQTYPWELMREWTGEAPWILAGGLTPKNVSQAILNSGAVGINVSSGVENESGSKDPALIAAFLKTVKGAGSGRWRSS